MRGFFIRSMAFSWAFMALAIGVHAEEPPVAIIIHGGAGSVDRATFTPEKEAAYRAALKRAMERGMGLLESGATSLDAVEAALMVLEDSPLFNAGKGAVFTDAGRNELDASIMDGATLEAGAVGGVTRVKNPIRAARAVMERTPHVMLSGPGADEFAEEAALEIVDNAYFRTEARREQWRKSQNFAPEIDRGGNGETRSRDGAFNNSQSADYLGTIGAVALDQSGNIAAGTSTGGLTNKKFGRIGDSPIIGAGTYADNATCGISCTGHGEFFIRYAVAYDVSARMAYKEMTLEAAARSVIQERLLDAGGRGGLIGLDRNGHVVAEFITPSMFRAWTDAAGNTEIAIFE